MLHCCVACGALYLEADAVLSLWGFFPPNIFIFDFAGRDDIVELLCAAAAVDESMVDPMVGGVEKVTPLHLAAVYGRRGATRVLLGTPILAAAQIGAADDNGLTPLHLAAWHGHLEVCAELLEAGAEPDCRSAGGETPLHLAVCASEYQSARRLLQAGADAGARDTEGNTAMHHCCRRGDIQLVELLLAASGGESSLGVGNLYRDTPLHAACYQSRVEVLTFLIGARLEPGEMERLLRIENAFSETPLHAAATSGKSPLLIATLLQQGVPVNICGQDGHTPLHSACWHGNREAANLLLINGADIRLKTYNGGETCIMWCYHKGFDSLLEILQQHAERLFQDMQFKGMLADKNAKGLEEAYNELCGLPTPSPLGRIRTLTKKKIDQATFDNLLPTNMQLCDQDFESISSVAEGSFGKVYRATYQGAEIAIKKYRNDHFHVKSTGEMFCREVGILAKLDHPNVLKLVGACTPFWPRKGESRGYSIVTEYVNGGNLYDALHEERSSFDFAVRLRIARGIAHGMRYLHELPRPIIHRDLNSHNVLLDSSQRPVVADFGESRFFDGAFSSPDVKDLTLQPGNLRWMAPEIFAQNSVYTLRSDVFSYALLLWELETGHVPFAELKAASAAAQIAYHRQRPIIPATCPQELQAILQAGWNHDARSRPSFNDILSWLDLHFGVAGVRDLSTEANAECSESVDVTRLARIFQLPSPPATFEALVHKNGYVTRLHGV